MLELKGTPAGCAHRRVAGGCEDCRARPYSVCAAVPDADLHLLDALAETVTLQAGEALFHQDDAAHSVFNVTSGSVRLERLLPDGRRHVAGFLFAGDFIGLSAGETTPCSAYAIEPATLCRFRRADWIHLMRENRALESALLQRAGHELAVAEARATLLARKTAMERVASFLLDLPASDPLRAGRPGQVRLPMTRSEIADYLGLTLETVSRSVSRLKKDGIVSQVALTELHVDRPAALRALAEGETV